MAVVAGPRRIAVLRPARLDCRIRQTAISPQGDLRIHLENAGGHPPFSLTLGQLQISDANGMWLDIRQADVQWHPWELLHHRLHIERLNAENVHLLRLPHTEEAKEKTG